jgi:hypothetical protein
MVEEKIDGTAVARPEALKGDVSGKNTGKKVLSRTLSGVGTMPHTWLAVEAV